MPETANDDERMILDSIEQCLERDVRPYGM